MAERVCIVGTAPSWRKTPWTDPGLTILGLNDAYRLNWPRADGWYDIHPMSKFHYTGGKPVYAHQVPPGHYVRPDDHVDWMSKLSIPLWLHEDPPEGWLHARKFPKAEIEAHFGCYMTSTPAWMLAHVIMQGTRDLVITGIHLATEAEYLEQRPNFEYLIGRMLGPGKIRTHLADGMRTYETGDAKVVLPEDSPILQSNFQYAYQTRPNAYIEPLKWEMHKLQVKHQRATQALRTRKWYQSSSKTVETLQYLEAAMEDTRQSIGRLQLGA